MLFQPKKDYLVRAILSIQMINKNYYYDIVVESLCWIRIYHYV